ncbi:apolipoprotein N-acyltransferase [Anseongella ginsenosidimutans]|uniref:Apolipoprotein N-acyltransferase n=1 Tax=Anseongella ginsenosidimutans TaxID=496056 RepID=A0A4R3L151_9SPHI|nr:apolipoprotein N-acyltransferase [Anseongella ginsenosidimutans]QEC51195.1 apolipoprotein N-acyltransferase [Anseongella ginsenosidimutans]TCS90132.1 apolipoprotein N-acyltransferase [Anseongella ginsenosidimutans]
MRKNKLLLPVLSGVLCWLAWPPTHLAPLLLVALVPLFYFADEALRSRNPGRTVLTGALLGFAAWNTLSLYWIYFVASGVGAVVGLAVVLVPILFGTVLMTLPFFLYHKTRKYAGPNVGLAAFCAYWIAAEYLHHKWDFAFPWLSLGNGFANYPSLVQWYEYTGIFGGTLWVLLANILAYRLLTGFLALKRAKKDIPEETPPGTAATDAGVPRLMASQQLSLGRREFYLKRCLPFTIILLFPMIFSLVIYFNYEEKGSPVNVVVVQPNLDPYGEKYNGVSEKEQLLRLVTLSDSLGQPNTEYFIWPETAIGTGQPLVENRLYDEYSIKVIQGFLEKYRNGNVITGASTVRIYDSPASPTARKFRDAEQYYDYYNTALQIENNGRVQVYHKNKLVPGVEQFPYRRYLGFLDKLMMDMGGTSGTLGHEDEQTVFYSQNGIGVVPAICYESVFGGFIADFVQKGAQLICIVTNDGWWGNTAGYKQHAAYARLRAIESRRSVARSANTGISMLINQRGDVMKQTSWWVPAAIGGELKLNADLTFYVKHGNYLARIATGIALLSLVGLLILSVARNAGKQGGRS